jgi:hypothetical protein
MAHHLDKGNCRAKLMISVPAPQNGKDFIKHK